jgi:hypothetical protein
MRTFHRSSRVLKSSAAIVTLAGALLTVGCQTAQPAASKARPAVSTASKSKNSAPSPGVAPAPAPAPGPAPAPATPNGQRIGGFEITVYYTAVESFHSGAPKQVVGCIGQACSWGNKVIGTYPSDFVQFVKDEGTGRITSGANAGKYLNWSHDVGYWLDSIPCNAYGQALRPFVSAAADSDVLKKGARFRLVAPLVLDDGTPAPSNFGGTLLGASWELEDLFTPGLGGPGHLDLYIGEEDQVNFTTQSPKFLTLSNATIELG